MTNTVPIAGASSGLGAALAIKYAEKGATLYLMGRDTERLEAVKSSCVATGATCEAIICDVSDEAQMLAEITAIINKNPIDLVIVNAGISGGTSSSAEGSAQTRQIFETNINGVLNTVLPALPNMTERGSGQVAIVSSCAGFRGLPGAPAYSASKNAVRAWGEALRPYYAPKGVKVNVICPGFIKTPLTDKNPFDMPLLMEADIAAEIIIKGLEANKPLIAFPWRLAAASRLISILPRRLSDWVVSRLPKK